MRTLALILLATFAHGTAHAGACSYCTKLEAIEDEFKSVKPEPENLGTTDRQAELVSESEDLSIKAIAATAAPTGDDWSRVLHLLSVAQQYDYDNTMSEDVTAALRSRHRIETFYAQMDKAKRAGTLSAAEFERLATSYGTAEHTIQEGTGEPGAH